MSTETHMPDATITVRQFTHRPTLVAAVQYLRTNECEAELEALLGEDFAVFKAEDAAVRTTHDGRWHPIFCTDWAVKTPEGAISLMAAVEFAAAYTEADRG